MPVSRLAGFVLVWVALAVFSADAVQGSRRARFAAAGRLAAGRPRWGPAGTRRRPLAEAPAAARPLGDARRTRARTSRLGPRARRRARGALLLGDPRALAPAPRGPPPPGGARHGRSLAGPGRRGPAGTVYGRGLLGALLLLAAERRLPQQVRRRQHVVLRRLAQAAVVAFACLVALVVVGAWAAVEFVSALLGALA